MKLYKTTTHELPCPLSTDEVMSKGEQLGQAVVEIKSLGEKISELRNKVKNLSYSKDLLAECIRSRSEYRDIPCSIYLDDETEKIELVTLRDDTKEEIFRREAVGEEKQMLLDLDND
jgi:hypothetical protein